MSIWTHCLSLFDWRLKLIVPPLFRAMRRARLDSQCFSTPFVHRPNRDELGGTRREFLQFFVCRATPLQVVLTPSGED
jgi:hypothetical protein